MFKTLGSRKHVKHQSYFFIMPSEGSSESKGVSRERGSEYTSLPVTVLPRDKTHRVYIDTYQSRCFIGIGSCCSRDWEVPQSDLLSASWWPREALGAVLVQTLRTMGASGVSSNLSPKGQESGASISRRTEDRRPSSNKRLIRPFCTFLFYSDFWEIGWCPRIDERDLLYSVYEFKC